MVKEITGLFFDHLLEAAVVCEIVIDDRGEIVDWVFRDANAAALRSIGLKREEVIGKTVLGLFSSTIVRWINDEYQRAKYIGESSPREAVYQQHTYLLSSFLINEITIALVASDITAHKQAEEERHAMAVSLADSEEKYREIAESITDPFAAYDANLCLVYSNAAFESITRIPRETAIGKPLAELYPAMVGSEAHQLYLRTLETHQPQRIQVHSTRPEDGQEFVFDLTTYPTRQGLVAFSKDITLQARAEEALRRSEEKFAKIFRSSPVAMGITSLADGRFIDVNSRYCEITDFTREEVIGRTGGELGIYVDPNQRDEILRLVLERGSVQDYEMSVRNKRGERITGLFSFERIVLDGQPCLLTTAIDITGRKQADQELRESRERERERASELEVLMDAVPAMIWISRDPQCRTMIGNRLGYEFLHMGPASNVSVTAPENEIAAQPYHNMKDGRELSPAEMPMQVAAATGKPARDYTFDLVFHDGTVCHLMGNVNPLFDGEGKPYGAVGAFIDITPIRQMEALQVEARAQIEVQRRLMEYREQERQGIARDLHDGPIQTLASTAFSIQLVKEAYQDPALRVELEGIAQSIKNAVRELRDTVNDLRPPSLIRFGLTRAMQMHSEDMQERHPEIEISLNLTEDQDFLSEQACLTLFRIFQEAMSNAMRHSGARQIAVQYGIAQDDFFLEVRDNGSGFEVRQDFTEIASNGHFGLMGMHERALIIGAELSVTSAPGQGTTIRVRGPMLGKNIK